MGKPSGTFTLLRFSLIMVRILGFGDQALHPDHGHLGKGPFAGCKHNGAFHAKWREHPLWQGPMAPRGAQKPSCLRGGLMVEANLVR